MAAHAPHRRTFGVDRVAALSDGVFAVMLTLLVLDLKIPEVPAADVAALSDALLAQVPNFMAWLVSFVLLARFWIVHHDVLGTLRACHVDTLAANFAVLGVISLVPFGSALIGTYEFDVAAVLLFSAILTLCGLALGAFARYVAGVPDLHAADADADLPWHRRYHSFGLPVFGLSAAGLAVIAHPAAALVTWLVEPLVAVGLTRRRARSAHRAVRTQ